MSKKRNEALSLLLSAALIFSGIMYVPGKVEAEEEGSDYGLSNPRVAYNYRDTVTFGSYWQEDTNGDGVADESDEKQPIVWQILERYEDGTALVLADKILDAGSYFDGTPDGGGEINYDCTWETSTIRKWLNEDFYNNAFSSNDKTAIICTDLVNNDNPEYGTEGGNDTKDNVFLLSLDEINNTVFGFDERWETYDQGRIAWVTSFAAENDAEIDSDGNGRWLLRSSGSLDYVAFVTEIGDVDYEGTHVNFSDNGIRPALKINLLSSSVRAGDKVKVSIKGAEWDTVIFGKYDDKEISWRVLNVTDDDAFLVSERSVTIREYNSKYEAITWKDSTIRKWLNGDFINNSFSDAEKEIIKTSSVINSDNVYYGTEGGEDTTDKIFLLSLRDMVQPGYGFPDTYWVYSETRVAKNSLGDADWWWLRSSGGSACDAAIVSYEGNVDCYGFGVDNSPYGVRPAMHINLSATSTWRKGEKITVGDSSGGEEVPLDSDSRSDIPLEEDDDVEPTSSSTAEPTSVPTSKPTEGPAPSVQPSAAVSPTITPTTTPSPTVKKDKVTTFSIKNKAKVKKTAKIKIKDKDKIKKITLNGKTVKIKKNKTSFTLKLKSYKKKLKKKGKWNTLKVTDKKGNVKSIKFKTK